MNIDLPWVADDLRDRPNDRSFIFERLKQALIDHHKPYVTVSGLGDERLASAVNAIKNHFAYV